MSEKMSESRRKRITRMARIKKQNEKRTLKKMNKVSKRNTGSGKRQYNDLVESISGIAEQLQCLNKQAVQEYSPIVESIIRSRSRDD